MRVNAAEWQAHLQIQARREVSEARARLRDATLARLIGNDDGIRYSRALDRYKRAETESSSGNGRSVMKLRIEIDMDNAAFEDAREVHRILSFIALDAVDAARQKIRDENGNTVGFWIIESGE